MNLFRMSTGIRRRNRKERTNALAIGSVLLVQAVGDLMDVHLREFTRDVDRRPIMDGVLASSNGVLMTRHTNLGMEGRGVAIYQWRTLQIRISHGRHKGLKSRRKGLSQIGCPGSN
jgi:hypothetical protein